MFGQDHYVPILKWKRGEQKALEHVSATSKVHMTPLIEIVPVPYDFVNEQPAKSVDQHLNGTSEQIVSSWGVDRPIFLDLYWIDPTERMSNGSHPLNFIIDEAHARGAKVIPVTGCDRDTDYQAAVKNANSRYRLGVCIRLGDDDFLDITNNLSVLLNSLEIEPSQVDLLIDLKEISSQTINANAMTVTTVINTIPNITAYRTLTLAASAFPENLSRISSGNVGSIDRVEWELWRLLNTRSQTIRRMPSFGDYAIANPFYSEIDPRIMQMSANIRYTISDEWLIFRGRSIKLHGWSQARDLARAIVSSRHFSGSTFSWGDQYIDDCSNGQSSTGNAETWRRVGTNHHLEFVIAQLANYNASLTAAAQTAAARP